MNTITVETIMRTLENYMTDMTIEASKAAVTGNYDKAREILAEKRELEANLNIIYQAAVETLGEQIVKIRVELGALYQHYQEVTIMDNINKLVKLIRELQKEIKALQNERDYWRDLYINEVIGTSSESDINKGKISNKIKI